ncbi:hypothetical protein Bca101_082128 [Brassica carinata]
MGDVILYTFSFLKPFSGRWRLLLNISSLITTILQKIRQRKTRRDTWKKWRNKKEETMSQKKEEEELHKQESLQLLKKKNKIDNLIKVTHCLTLSPTTKTRF